MKKIFYLFLVLLMGIAITFISCNKNNEKTETLKTNGETEVNDPITGNDKTPSKPVVTSEPTVVNTYTVNFYGMDNDLIESVEVNEGNDALAPNAPFVEGYDFLGWDKEFSNVNSDLDIHAIYEVKKAYKFDEAEYRNSEILAIYQETLNKVNELEVM